MTGAMKLNPYLRKIACKTCPFRRSVVEAGGLVRAERAQSIADSIIGGAGFTCHLTTVLDESDDAMEAMIPGPDAQECAGALATMHAGGNVNQMARMAERFGMLDLDKIDVDRSDVYGSLAAWVQAHRPPTELVHCEVVGPDCQDPPGFSTGSGVVGSTREPTCDPDNCCQYCGHTMCEDCGSGTEYVCVICAEHDDGDEDE
jgi:hypothetical protein